MEWNLFDNGLIPKSQIPSYLYPPVGISVTDRMVSVFYDRYIVFQIKVTDDIITLEGDNIFTGTDEFGFFLWRVFDGYLGKYLSTGYYKWEHSAEMRKKYSKNCVNSSVMALSLVDFSHNAHIESMEKIWIDDECGAHLLTDSEIYAWKNKFTDEEHKMARHPNRSDRWMPQRVRKEINSWVRGRLTCNVCGINNFHSFRDAGLHEQNCTIENPRLIRLKKHFGIS
tara:strand:- start:1638 stop:2315 length:678 start_codon:yes stop_codon:yes gene_type:complete